jgi:small nuclear ribonucleoprotein
MGKKKCCRKKYGSRGVSASMLFQQLFKISAHTLSMVLPTDLLESSLNKDISLLLKDGRVLEGRLSGYDQYMNLVIEDTREAKGDAERRLGKVVLRGNNIVSISVQ